MQRSSESVAALAGALAKAQAELVNPEKSLIATIGSERRGEVERSFRYASLASGLDIVRKTLSKHEIAAIQTTAIDPATRTVNLTTMLAHVSGEWIASDWPVCTVADTATPRRMGAALTYARRYGLFTLVGIAGEDDIDAPDLSDSGKIDTTVPPVAPRPNGKIASTKAPILGVEESETLRRQLEIEIANLKSITDATAWANRSLGAKNKLTASDAALVEEAFRSRIARFEDREDMEAQPGESLGVGHSESQAAGGTANAPVDKSVLTLAEPRRYRDKQHLKFVSSQACLVCGRQPSDPHHLRFVQRRALARKVSDEFTVPLCRTHHRELHRSSNEAGWWSGFKIDPIRVSRKLWRKSRNSTLPTIRK